MVSLEHKKEVKMKKYTFFKLFAFFIVNIFWMPTALALNFHAIQARSKKEQPIPVKQKLVQLKPTQSSTPQKDQRVRTTAYTHTEKGGRHSALGPYLSGRHVMSAASDWSRYPVGTRFRIVETKEEFRIDDYGSALVGTNTIDLYKTTRRNMNLWGVRYVNIDILQWGSYDESLKVLQPRAKYKHVRRMILELQKKRTQALQASNRTYH